MFYGRRSGWLAPLTIAFTLTTIASDSPIHAQSAGVDQYRHDADRIIAAATGDRFAWNRLAELTDTFGPRLSGSKNLDQAIEWAMGEMKKDGFDNVRAEPVTVPVWVRGRESLEVLEPGVRSLPMLGLGDSIGTPPDGIDAEVLVVDSFDALDRDAARARGRIVLFNVPFTTYGETVR